jgi:hypothetical protein
MLHKDYYRKGSVEKISGRESQGAWRQDELIGGKLWLIMSQWRATAEESGVDSRRNKRASRPALGRE